MDKSRLICESIADRLRVSPEIHPQDFIFRFIQERITNETDEQAIENYFNDGAKSAQKLNKILTEICGFGSDQIHLLEFASGYGMVTRHIKKVLPYCVTTSCDIHQQAVRFIHENLETEAILSTSQPEDLILDKQFDVVFALSFFSHMPKDTFSRWLKKLATFAKSEGYLIFTTHGLLSQKLLHRNFEFDEDGFYYRQKSEQRDLNKKEYGTTFVTPQYVINQLAQIPNLILNYFHEGYWWGHQDVYIAKIEAKYIASPRIVNIVKNLQGRSLSFILKKLIQRVRSKYTVL